VKTTQLCHTWRHQLHVKYNIVSKRLHQQSVHNKALYKPWPHSRCYVWHSSLCIPKRTKSINGTGNERNLQQLASHECHSDNLDLRAVSFPFSFRTISAILDRHSLRSCWALHICCKQCFSCSDEQAACLCLACLVWIIKLNKSWAGVACKPVWRTKAKKKANLCIDLLVIWQAQP